MKSRHSFRSTPSFSSFCRLGLHVTIVALLVLGIGWFSASGLARAQDSHEWVVGASLNQNPDEETPITVTGELTILYADDFASNRGKFLYFLKDFETNETFELRLARSAPGDLRSGSVVTARGKARGRKLYLVLDDSGEEGIETVLAAQTAVAGEQRTLVMVADFLDASTSCSVASIEDLMFSDPTDNSVDDLYTETSHAAIWFSGDVVGPYAIDYSKDACSVEAWANAADAAAQADGINLEAYSRKVYVLPMNACPASGVATVGDNPSRAWVFTCDLADVFAHELGHNLGMGHASTPGQSYGDTSDVMGLGGGPLRQINAPHKEQMGWLSPEQIVAVTDGGIYEIAPLELDPAQAAASQALKIYKPDTDEYYYLSYRCAIGFDANLSSGHLDRLTVHRYSGDGSASSTYLLAQLDDNESFVDAINGITITQVTHNSERVAVELQFEGADPTCTAAVPTVSLSPTSQTGEPGTTRDYIVSVGNLDSPACGASLFALGHLVPPGWTGALSPASLSVQPGDHGLATFSVTSPAGSTAGSSGVMVEVTDAAEPLHTASGSGSYVVQTSCSLAAPAVSVSPTSQSAGPGTLLEYTLTLTNADGFECGESTFSLVPTLPSLWEGSISPSSLILSAGESGTAILWVTSGGTAAGGTYTVGVDVVDLVEPLHSAAGSASYVVDEDVAGDTEPPASPTGLSARVRGSHVRLSWNAAADNVGVSGYLVRRGDASAPIADVVETAYVDRSVSPDATYTYWVQAYDGAGNISAPSGQVTVTVEKTRTKRAR